MKEVKTRRQFETRLKKLRGEIDRLDEQLIHLLAKRFRIVAKIGDLKHESREPVVQKRRWSEMMKERRELAMGLGMSSKFVARIFGLIQDEAILLQKKKGPPRGTGSRRKKTR